MPFVRPGLRITSRITRKVPGQDERQRDDAASFAAPESPGFGHDYAPGKVPALQGCNDKASFH